MLFRLRKGDLAGFVWRIGVGVNVGFLLPFCRQVAMIRAIREWHTATNNNLRIAAERCPRHKKLPTAWRLVRHESTDEAKKNSAGD